LPAQNLIDSEADAVRLIFRLYAALGSVRMLQAELEARGNKSKSCTSDYGRPACAKPSCRGARYLILQTRTCLCLISCSRNIHHHEPHQLFITTL